PPTSTPPTTPPTSTPPTSTPPTSTPPTAGTAGTAGTAAAQPTGTVGTAAAGTNATSTSAFNGYRLTGSDLAQWAGKRVEVTGSFVPSSSANTTASATGSGSTTLQEFRVVSLKAVGGSCPQN
ncbi:MAG TPA: hypothetical protein VKH42_17255, partial [Vicinamibacterales bacterium]|nr:hypothetical protein [Vicinamibacterales bacterium]